ncbi:class I SAM-dependent methyltransferase [Roseicyclus marinus]|uniref:MFS transporter n=1 Tax=Roseicyclus marinus TaxID=2161673 RepID=A0AA48HVC1_9RHOB|nr:MFS transporter [Roseicyclus marinus]
MTPDRWILALEAGEIALPPGPVVVLRARGDGDFAALGDVTCVQGFAPDHDMLSARSLRVMPDLPEGEAFSTALVQIVKARAGTMASIAEALMVLRPGGLLMVDGQKEEGIETILKTLRAVLDIGGVLSKAHGKLIWLTRPDTLPEAVMGWMPEPTETEEGYVTVPGGFSAEGPDRGSELLVALVPPLSGRVADLGAGWGYVAGEILSEQDQITAMDLIEADHAMLEAAAANIDDPRARFHWADVTRFQPEGLYDAILANPPFHTGRRADPALGRAFIAAAARMLSPRGRFFMVANRHLPYEDALKAAFGTGRLLGELEGYKIYEAAKPKR